MARVFKRANGILYLEYEVDGKTRQRSTRLPDTKENRAFIKKQVIPELQRKILSGELSANKPQTFKYYSKKYLRDKEQLKSYSTMQRKVDVLNLSFGDMFIDNINRSHIKDWVYERLKINTPQTVRNYLPHLKGVIDSAIDDEVISNNPAKNIALPKTTQSEIEPFTSEEVQLLLDKANEWYRLFLSISFYTGMRTSEVLALKRSDIDLENMVIRVKRSISKGKITTPKNEGSVRDVPILDGLVPYLSDVGNISDWLFSKDDGSHYYLVAGWKKKEWKKLLKDCKIKYRKLYTTRHTFIVSMLKNSDLSIFEVAQIVGHSSTRMIIQNYGKFIKGEHLKIDRKINPFG